MQIIFIISFVIQKLTGYEPKNKFEEKRLNLLANLIATVRLDIKIAFIEKNNVGIFHEKMGLMYDHEGNVIAFAGSMNESDMAFSHNYESIDVFCSWTYDEERVKIKEAAFNAVWNDLEPGVEIVDSPFVKEEIIKNIYVQMILICVTMMTLMKNYILYKQ